MTDSILRLPTVMERTGLSRSVIYEQIQRGQFPRQVSLGARSVGWLSSEVDAWLQARVGADRKPWSPPVAAKVFRSEAA